MNNKLLPKKSKKNIFLLSAIGLLHFCCITMAAHLDLFRRSEYSFASASNICYWLWISSWWCIWVGWLTIIWVIYKLTKKAKKSYFEQIFDLTVLIANLLMILAFLANFIIYYFWKVEWIYVPDTDNPHRVITLFNSWPVKTQTYFWFNIAISHIVVPFIILYHFLKFSQVDLLRKKFRTTIVSILANPAVWFLFVIIREKISNYWIHPNKLSYEFPRNYPYVFFYRIMGQQAYEKDINYSHSLVSRFLWLLGTILVAGLVFSLLTYFLIKWKEKINHKTLKNNIMKH
ncbi:hypothetical protein [endosymbiont GvMRE of Glomus versiforme]|uniref:hypothetical protein n=1 Tax=endosymbiont GvMRE of Glomus versiforme TaxID=2039283 RepID=UPI000ED13892|nr:hypothetical protein [endosymbiont GvMRE of Glomus versiforme]RHZ36564.1 hypothetical protein GvMRE_I2g184 [endosymbiont GvMRE of Glomus versiforme]